MASARPHRALDLTGKRVLIVEDEFLLAMQVESELLASGCTFLGPYTNLSAALSAARSAHIDLALLDINLDGEMVYPLADELTARGVPFVFVSGYGTADLPVRFRANPRVGKPFEPALLVETIRRAIAPG